MSANSHTSRVRYAMATLGRATRLDLRAHLPDIDHTVLDERISSLKCQREIVVEDETVSVVLQDGRVKHVKVYRWAGGPVAVRMGVKKPLHRADEGLPSAQWAPGHFTADIRSSSWRGLLGAGA